jgi:hypothetical protein
VPGRAVIKSRRGGALRIKFNYGATGVCALCYEGDTFRRVLVRSTPGNARAPCSV